MTQRELHNYTCTLCPESLDKAQRELNEDPKTRKLEIQALRERLLRYPGLTSRVDDAFLIKFLRPRKFDQERTFELILNYYKMKKENEDIYAQMSPKYIKHVLDAELMCVLPQGGKMGETVIVILLGKYDTESVAVEDFFRAQYLIMSTVMESEEAQVNGVRILYDMKGFGMNHITAVPPSMIQKMSKIYQDSFPARVKGVHHMNEPTIFDVFYAVIKPFLKEKLTKRVHFHGEKVEELHDFIHPEYLPEEYGGKLPSFCHKDFNRRLLEKQAHFEEDAKFGFVSMTIKGESQKSQDAMENLPGTFKKLNVD